MLISPLASPGFKTANGLEAEFKFSFASSGQKGQEFDSHAKCVGMMEQSPVYKFPLERMVKYPMLELGIRARTRGSSIISKVEITQ